MQNKSSGPVLHIGQDGSTGHRANLLSPFMVMVDKRALIFQLTKREIASRFQGSIFGILWVIALPLLFLAAYTFVFGIMFQARWDSGGGKPLAYGLSIFIGIILHGVLADCIVRAPTLITSRTNLVKKVVFPLEILPIVQVLAALFQGGISLVLWLIAVVVLGNGFGWPVLTIPVFVLPLLLHALGFTWILAALGVFIRDVSQATSLITTALLFLSPIFYPSSALPPSFAPIIFFNPLAYSIEAVRNAVFGLDLPSMGETLFHYGFALLVASLGYKIFQATRKGFADVL